jgi:hypothetical protein
MRLTRFLVEIRLVYHPRRTIYDARILGGQNTTPLLRVECALGLFLFRISIEDVETPELPFFLPMRPF